MEQPDLLLRTPGSRTVQRLRAGGVITALALAAAALVAPATARADDLAQALRPSPGAPGLGDSLYPTLGNGGYRVSHYDLDLTYPTGTPSGSLDGTVTVHARSTQALSRFDLDFGGDSVGSVSVDGRPAGFVRNGDELVITPATPLRRDADFTVTVRHFVATPTVPDPNEFLSTVFVSTPDGTVWSGQPNAAHKIFPSNDHPSDKATFSFRIDAPAGTTAVANGELTDKRTASGRTVWRYEEREPMATELAQVAVGAFTVTDRGRHAGVAFRDVTPTRLTAALSPKLAVETAQLDWLEARLGDYPFRSYGSLVVDASLGFALETQTLSLYDNVFFTGYPQGVWDPVMLHELTHQWFGDSVAPTRWADVWQNEGHATWYEWTYAAEKGFLADDTGIADFTALMKAVYAAGDRYRASYGPVGSPLSGDVNDVFNPNVYDGGALVLYALRQKIGTPAFERLERAWVTLNRGHSASTAEFIALASVIAHQDLRGFLTDWLYGTKTPPMPGHPDWTVTPVTATARAASPTLPHFVRR